MILLLSIYIAFLSAECNLYNNSVRKISIIIPMLQIGGGFQLTHTLMLLCKTPCTSMVIYKYSVTSIMLLPLALLHHRSLGLG